MSPSTTSKNHIVMVTSIPPRIKRLVDGIDIGRHYQRMCVESWVKAGVKLVSVNSADEADIVQTDYPEVTVFTSQVDARGEFGRPFSYLSSCLAALIEFKAPVVGFVNSDILYTGTKQNLLALCTRVSRGCSVVAFRYDVDRPDSPEGKIYRHGFDFFAFDLRTANSLRLGGFALGVPWWDYWIPLQLALDGCLFHVEACTSFRHLLHQQAWSQELWCAGLVSLLNQIRQYTSSSQTTFENFVCRSTLELMSPNNLPPFGSGNLQRSMGVALGIFILDFIDRSKVDPKSFQLLQA